MISDLERELEKLHYGSHICPIYDAFSEQVNKAVLFIKHGLKNGNRCLYLADDLSVEKRLRVLKAEGVDVNQAQASDALKILNKRDIYLQSDEFDPERMIAFLEKAEAEALADGFSGLWFMGEMHWVSGTKIKSETLIKYEILLNEFLVGRRVVAFCQYAQDDFDLGLIYDVLATHPLVIVNDLLCFNPYFKAPQLLLSDDDARSVESKRMHVVWWLQRFRADREFRLRSLAGMFGADEQLEKVNDIAVENHEINKLEIVFEESETLLHQLVTNIQEVFWMIDIEKTRLIYVSPGFENISGFPAADIYKNPLLWFDMIHPEDKARIRETYTKPMIEKSEEVYRILRPDGRLRWIRNRAYPVYDGGTNVSRVVGVAEDITQYKELEDQLQQAQKMQAVGKLAGGMAHDFNNLLAIISSYAELVKMEKNLNDEQLEFIKEIERAVHKSSELTRQLLIFSRQNAIRLQDITLNETITNITKLLQRTLGEDIHLELQLPSEALNVYADVGMIDQILINLCVNARQAMANGGQLLIKLAAVTFKKENISQYPDSRAGDFACIQIEDTGIGIEPEILPKIFDPFFTTRDVGEGSGLGLSTIYGIVQQHKGWIYVHSEVGKGTAFYIYLPLLKNVSKPANKEKLHSYVSRSNETILLVEDEVALRNSIKRILIGAGYKIIDMPNALAALEFCESPSNQIDLLLTDLVLPQGMNGYNLSQILLKQNPQLKAVFMSGYNRDMLSMASFLREGVNYLVKPFQSKQLVQIIWQSLAKSSDRGL